MTIDVIDSHESAIGGHESACATVDNMKMISSSACGFGPLVQTLEVILVESLA